jgi:hypothetical protein
MSYNIFSNSLVKEQLYSRCCPNFITCYITKYRYSILGLLNNEYNEVNFFDLKDFIFYDNQKYLVIYYTYDINIITLLRYLNYPYIHIKEIIFITDTHPSKLFPSSDKVSRLYLINIFNSIINLV